MAHNWKALIEKVLLISVSALLGILLCEYSVRFLYPQVTLYPRYVDSPEYPIAFPRNAELTHAKGDRWKFIYHTNELGRRGPYLPISEEYNPTNVVALGDSFTFGQGVNDDEVYTYILPEQLGDSFAVVNGGMAGWGIDSEIKWYYKTGKFYRPKYVILQFTENDTTDSFTGVTRIENEKFTFHSYPNSRPKWQLFVSNSYVLQNSHLFSLFRAAYDKTKKNVPATESGASTRNIANNSPQLNYINMLKLFTKELNEQGVALLFLSVTYPDRSHDNYFYDLHRFPIIEKEVEHMNTSGMLHFIELPLDQMQKFPGSPEGHQWSAAHHEIVGKEIARKILELEKQDQNSPGRK